MNVGFAKPFLLKARIEWEGQINEKEAWVTWVAEYLRTGRNCVHDQYAQLILNVIIWITFVNRFLKTHYIVLTIYGSEPFPFKTDIEWINDRQISFWQILFMIH